MQIIPAIDIKDGKCVRLRQGRMDEVSIFADDPLEAAAKWVAQGSKRLHLVDLDGAVAGEAVSKQIIHAICAKYPELQIQIGGGIRTQQTIEDYIAAGVSYVIIGTKAVQEPDFLSSMAEKYPRKIILGVDAQDGYVAIAGWQQTSQHLASEFIAQFNDTPLAAIVYTDISRDGMLSGVNVEATAALARSTNIGVIASGGVSNITDIEKLLAVRDSGITGAIVGRSIYEGTLDLAQATALCNS
jgi:phosphoribosylformimino-5-aminoimidazole carboxamide ribotide isomerase